METNRVKSDGGGKVVAVFTITETVYLMLSLFYDLVLTLSYLYLWYQVLWLCYLPCFRHSDKTGYGYDKSHLPYSGKNPSYQVSFKEGLSLNSFLQIVRFLV